MIICKYCKFDSLGDSLIAEGAPCGFNDCIIFTCCKKAWDEHMKTYHKGEVDKETGKKVE